MAGLGIPLVLGAVGLVGLMAAAGAGAKPKPVTTPQPSPPGTVPPISTDQGKVMSVELQRVAANALKALGVDSDGNLTGPVTAESLQLATSAAAMLEANGFPETAAAIRSYVKKAAVKVPSPPPEKQAPLPSLSPQEQEMVNRVLAFERDPKVLQAVLDGLKAKPNQDPQLVAVEKMLESLIAQVLSQQATGGAIRQVDEVIRSPGIPQPQPPPPVSIPIETRPAPSPPPAPAPVPIPPQPPAIVTPPVPIPVPPIPIPQPAPAPKSQLQVAAGQMVLNLKNVQNRYGMPAAKGKEDTSLVKRFQSLDGQKQDGKAGPGTLLAAARAGESDLPLVMYWPTGANKDRVFQYRNDIRNVADIRRAEGNVVAAQQLEASATRERGQAGIVGSMPA